MLRKLVTCWRAVLAIVVMFGLLTAAAAAGFAADIEKAGAVQEEPGTPIDFLPPQPHFSAVATPDSRGCLIVPKRINIYQLSPKQITIPVMAVNVSSGTGVKLLEIVISDKSGKERARLAPNAELKSVADVAPAKEKMPLLLDDPESPGLITLLERSYVNPEVVVPVEDLVTGEGSVFTLLTTATFESGRAKHTATAESFVTVASLPSRPGWYAGDGHIHTNWSDGGYTINSRASQAKSDGFKWIIVTDHEDKMRANGGWPSYVSAVNSAQSSYGIVVAPGGEIACVQTQGNENSPELGHALGYRLKESATSIPRNKYYTPQNLINAINNHNYPYSYAVIAHPYRAKTWQDWSVTGFRAMELLSHELGASSSTISKWVSLLKTNLASTIAGNGFVVGLGNTDAHILDRPGSNGATWIYAPDYSPTNRAAVWNAIKAGKASATGKGNLGVFSINGYTQGSVVRLPAGGSTFKVVQQPATYWGCTKFEIINRDGNVVKTVTNPATETTISWTAPSQDWFYFVRFLFVDVDGFYSEVWSNPIFLDVY